MPGRLLKLLDDRLAEVFDKETIDVKAADLKTRATQIKEQLARIDRDTVNFVDNGLLVLDLVRELKGAFDGATPTTQAHEGFVPRGCRQEWEVQIFNQ